MFLRSPTSRIAAAAASLAIIALAVYVFFERPSRVERPRDVRSVPDFTLLDQAGISRGLRRLKHLRAIALAAYPSDDGARRELDTRLKELARRTPDVETYFLDSTQPAPRAAREADRERLKLEQDILLDPAQIVGPALGLAHEGEVVFVRPADGAILARGQLDATTLERLAAWDGRAPVTLPPATGAPVSCGDSREYDYARDVAPVIAARCLNCHDRGGRFPPVLNSYEKVVSWSAMIRETIFSERMPPFSGDAYFNGPFQNDISLRPHEKRMLVRWMDDGLPRRRGEDPLVARARITSKAQRFVRDQNPIYSARMPKPAPVPPGGTLEYPFYQLGGPVPYDLWVEAINVSSTNPRTVHHASLMVTSEPLDVYVKASERMRDQVRTHGNKDGDLPIYVLQTMMARERKQNGDFFRQQVWGAGRQQPFLISKRGDHSIALFVPKGSYLILETHYMGTGRAETEQTTIDFYGTREDRGQKRMQHLLLATADIKIPPGAHDAVATSPPVELKHDVFIHALLGHMHMRGRAIRLLDLQDAAHPATLFSVPNFYYGWQTGSGLVPARPLRVKKGSRLAVACEYDNSPENPNNPNPAKEVFYGQTVDRAEMCHMSFSFTLADEASANPLDGQPAQK